MRKEFRPEQIALQFLVQEILRDLSRYYERYQQRSLHSESVQGMKKDVKDYVLPDELPERNQKELDKVFGAVTDQLNSSIETDTRSVMTYLSVFEEWCEEKLNESAQELLTEATEETPQAQKWLDQVRSNSKELSDNSVSEELHKKYQNRITDRWNTLVEYFSEL